MSQSTQSRPGVKYVDEKTHQQMWDTFRAFQAMTPEEQNAAKFKRAFVHLEEHFNQMSRDGHGHGRHCIGCLMARSTVIPKLDQDNESHVELVELIQEVDLEVGLMVSFSLSRRSENHWQTRLEPDEAFVRLHLLLLARAGPGEV